MNIFLLYLNNIWNSYPIEFLVLIVTGLYTSIRITNDFLPIKYKINKRFGFLIKIEKVICQIKISIPTKEYISFDILKNKFNSFWNENTSNVREINAPLSFCSNLSGSAYEVNSIEDYEENKNFVTISNFNGFTIGIFGSIKNLDIATNEILKITELFNNDRRGTDKVLIEISITPRLKKYLQSKSKLSIEYTKDNCSYTSNFKQIKIVNEGFSSLKENIIKVIYEWIDIFI